jgi:hypothetical protein
VSLDNFAPLIGRWRLSGEAEGEVGYRWADENHIILFQDFDIRVFGPKSGRGPICSTAASLLITSMK